ncbi:hypothetical protein Syun_017122 [Stephania yunnanensis]|uniref:Uncharacterized protein n=1 Tax=Stephania yunnanensis TaxID=152371 RepID=A0AAP0J7X9_9MAGN
MTQLVEDESGMGSKDDPNRIVYASKANKTKADDLVVEGMERLRHRTAIGPRKAWKKLRNLILNEAMGQS